MAIAKSPVGRKVDHNLVARRKKLLKKKLASLVQGASRAGHSL
jgi:hypothetical protein